MRYGKEDGQWARVEIFGHVEHVGRAREEPFLDGKVLRVCDETEREPIEYGLGAIFSIRWLSEEDGAREATKRFEEWEEQGKRHARGKKIGAIQQTIRKLLDGKRMTASELLEAVRAASPDVTAEDVEEARNEMMLTVIEGEDGEPTRYEYDLMAF